MNLHYTFLIGFLITSLTNLNAQPPAGAVAARPNIIYYAGGSCVFYDNNNKALLSVDANEAGWSATPAKTAWVVVTPANGGYYEFPNYSANPPTCNKREYMLPFWSSDTIFNELVLLSGINSSARLMFSPKKIIKVTNYDFQRTFAENTDYTISGNKIIQKSATLSASYNIKAGVKGNGQPNGLMNVNPASWTCVTYIPDRQDWQGNDIIAAKGTLLPNTVSKLKNKQILTLQAYGMSITAGLNVSGFAGDDKNFKPTAPYMHSYVDLFGEELARKYKTTVNTINGSCGGKTVAWIDKYCKEMVNPNNPDLVILDMGMNDIWGTTTAAAFRASMKSCIDKIKLGCPNAEFILIGNMLPDVNSPGSPANGNTIMYGFLQELKSLEGPGIAVFDMTSLSDTIYKRKGATHCHSNSLHPNDYLARWYAQGLVNLLNTSNSMSTTYYVNTTGNNTDGLSVATAWTNLTKVNSFSFKPGDTLLFEGGKTFAGNLNFDAFDAGNSTTKLVLKSYGTGGKAKIKTNSSAVCGFKATNTQGITIENLIFEGPGTTLSKDMDGIQFYTDLPTGKLSGIELKNTEISQFGYCGIRFISKWDVNVKSGFENVLIQNCSVHDCRENGIVSIAYDDQNTQTYNHGKFHLTGCEVYNIPGYSASTHKGSGIVLSQIDSALIEYTCAHHTGTENTACGGPGGIWVWSANRINIQFCESHHNSSGLGKGCDGLGFDLDGGVTNSKIQYCYAHDNDGAGYLLGNFDGARPWGNNTIRFNISVNDALTNNSPVTLFTGPNTTWNKLQFYHNTIIANPSAKNAYPSFSAFQITDYGTSMKNIQCYNNIFLTSGGLPFVNIPNAFVAENPAFKGNLYWSASANPKWIYGSNTYSTLSDFRNAGIHCEKSNSTAHGIYTDPNLEGIGTIALTLFPKTNEQLINYVLKKNSAAIDAGLNLQTLFNINSGNRDFWGNTIAGAIPDIGAHEFSTTSTYSKIKNTNIQIYPNPVSTDCFQVFIPGGQYLYKVDLINSTGQKIAINAFTITPEGYMVIKLEKVPSGLYNLMVLSKNGKRYLSDKIYILN